MTIIKSSTTAFIAGNCVDERPAVRLYVRACVEYLLFYSASVYIIFYIVDKRNIYYAAAAAAATPVPLLLT